MERRDVTDERDPVISVCTCVRVRVSTRACKKKRETLELHNLMVLLCGKNGKRSITVEGEEGNFLERFLFTRVARDRH